MNTKTICTSNSFIHYVFQNILLDTLKFPIFDFLRHYSNGVGGIPKIYEKRPALSLY